MLDALKVTEVLDKIASTLEEKGLMREAVELDIVANTIEKLAKKEKKWIQKAVPESHEGKFKAWCKDHGHGDVCQKCIDEAVAAGGKAQKMALFAVNVSKGKYTYPEKDE